jgi:hypothetical protein
MSKARARKIVAGRTAKLARLAPLARPRPSAPPAATQVCLGVLVGWDGDAPLVDFEGNPNGPLRARVAGPALRPPTGAPGARQEVVLLVDARPRRPPVVLGVLRPLGGTAAWADVDAKVDGRRVELEGRDEIVLRCGPASITLRRNGRVVIRGAEVETRASGVNRIKGGSVSIN